MLTCGGGCSIGAREAELTVGWGPQRQSPLEILFSYG